MIKKKKAQKEKIQKKIIKPPKQKIPGTDDISNKSQKIFRKYLK